MKQKHNFKWRQPTTALLLAGALLMSTGTAAVAAGRSDTADNTYFDTYEPGNTDVNILNGGTIAEDGDLSYYSDDSGIYLAQGTDADPTLLAEDDAQNLNVQDGNLYYTVQDLDTAYIKSLDTETLDMEDVTVLDGSIAQMYAVSENYFCYLLDGTVYGFDREQDSTERLVGDGDVFSFAVTEHGLVYTKGNVFDLTVYAGDTAIATDIQTYYTDDGYLVLSTADTDYQVELESAFEGDAELEDLDLHGAVSLDEVFDEEHTGDCPECAANYEAYLNGEISLEDYALEETETHSDDGTAVFRTLSVGQDNILKRTMQQATIKWTPLKDVDGWRNQTRFTAGTTYTGIPYGQPVTTGDYVPYEQSFTTFANAVKDISGVFYTIDSYWSGNAGSTAPYYASDCSAFVSWSWDYSGRKTTASLGGDATVVGTGSSILSAQVGDALNSNSIGHCALVTKVEYDSAGQVTAIEIMEQTPPIIKTTRYGSDGTYTLAYLQEKYSKYSLLRYKFIPSITYTPDPAVPLNGESGYSTFTDVGTSDWFYEAVQYSCENNIFSGTSSTTFSPDDTMTRGQLVTILGKTSGVNGKDYAYTGLVNATDVNFRSSATSSVSTNIIGQVHNGDRVAIIGVSGDWYQIIYSGKTGYIYKQYVTSQGGVFSDVDAGEYYTGFVEWAYYQGLITGTSATTFGAEENITREDLCTIVYKYSQVCGITLDTVNTAVTFTDDSNISDYAREAISALQQAGILCGYEDGSFQPGNSIERSEVAAIFSSFHRNYLA